MLPSLRDFSTPPWGGCGPPTPDDEQPIALRNHPLSPIPQIVYNPHSPQAGGSVQPVLPGEPASAVVGLVCAGPAV
jgi:hypothetical protein